MRNVVVTREKTERCDVYDYLGVDSTGTFTVWYNVYARIRVQIPQS